MLTPNEESKKLEIDLYGDLAGILSLAANKNGPLDESDRQFSSVTAACLNAEFEGIPKRLGFVIHPDWRWIMGRAFSLDLRERVWRFIEGADRGMRRRGISGSA